MGKNLFSLSFLDLMLLVLENKRFVGDTNLMIKESKEHNIDKSKRDIIIELESEANVQELLKIGKITYKEFELIPLSYRLDNLSTIRKNTITYKYTDTYKYPFYLLTLNREFLKNFKDELEKIDAKINQIDENNIFVEKILKDSDLNIEDDLNFDFSKFIDYFEKKYFSKFEIKNIDEILWSKARSKAIDFCNQNDKASLIYRNKPENYLRIDGEKRLIEQFSNTFNYF